MTQHGIIFRWGPHFFNALPEGGTGNAANMALGYRAAPIALILPPWGTNRRRCLLEIPQDGCEVQLLLWFQHDGPLAASLYAASVTDALARGGNVADHYEGFAFFGEAFARTLPLGDRFGLVDGSAAVGVLFGHGFS